MSEPSLQDHYAPNNACFGCGPANAKGLRIKSFPRQEGGLRCTWTPEAHHEAFAGVLNGGIIGALLDCHSNWTALWHLKEARGLERPPLTVTAEMTVKMLRPTPTDGPVELISEVVDSDGDRVVVEARLEARGKVTATLRGVFVAVPDGHPAAVHWQNLLRERGAS